MLDLLYARKVRQWSGRDYVQEDWKRMRSECFNMPANFRALDFGCNAGDFMYMLRHVFSKCWVTGVEPNEAAHTLARLIHPYIGSCMVTQLSEPTVKYDVVFVSHVINHVEDPYQTLSTLRNMTQKNGIIVLVNPNYWYLACNPLNWFRGDKTVKHHVKDLSWMLHEAGWRVEVNDTVGQKNWLGIRPRVYLRARNVK